jgi:diketogulonate reductase-like aldo/keto reductase
MSTTIESARALHDIRMPLNNGHDEIPALGFGTLITDSMQTRAAIELAMEVGFRHFDCAERYRNEKEIGEAMQKVFRKGIVTREKMFVTTKLWNTNHRPDRVPRAFEDSRKRLGLDYLDLYLIHTPFAFEPGDDQDPRDASGNPIYDEGVKLLDTWNAMERLVENGSCKAIGVSNFTIEQTEEILHSARIKPAVLQVEAHPYCPQWDLLAFCKQHGIVMLAFAPLGHAMEPRLLDDPVITGVARTVGQAPSQVLLAWAIQRRSAVITTSTNPRHIEESFAVSALPEEAMKQISEAVTARVRFNAVVDSGVPGFIPQGR